MAETLPFRKGPGPERQVGIFAKKNDFMSRFLGLFAVGLTVLLAIPIASIAFSLFSGFGEIWDHLLETVLLDYLLNTLGLVFLVGLGVTTMGVTTAWLVTFCKFPGRRLFEWTLILPLAVPAYVSAYAYTDFLQFSGPLQSGLRAIFGWGARDYWFPSIHSLWGAASMLALVLYPYVYLLTRAAFLEQSVCALEVGRTLGCSPLQAVRRVTIPMARPAIIAGTTLALMETLADFGTVQYFGVKTFTTGIYRAWFSMGDRITAAQLSAALLSVIALVILLERLHRQRRRYHHATNRYQMLPEYKLTGAPAALAMIACLLPILFGFAIPAIILINLALDAGQSPFNERYLVLVENSVILAAVTAVCAVVLASLLAYCARLKLVVAAGSVMRAAGFGYAIPGSVIAVGTLIPFAWFDNSLDRFFTEAFGISTGLLLTGSIAALIFAYLVRFLAVSLQSVENGLGKIRPSMDDAARSLGRTPGSALREVHVPLMWGSLLTALLMVFVDVMKELPATLIIRPFNFDTLAVQAYNFAADERLSEAALPALTIVIAGLLPVVLLSRAIAKSRAGSHR